MAIPLRKGQLSVREVINGEKLLNPISAHEALTSGRWDPLGELLEDVDDVKSVANKLGYTN